MSKTHLIILHDLSLCPLSQLVKRYFKMFNANDSVARTLVLAGCSRLLALSAGCSIPPALGFERLPGFNGTQTQSILYPAPAACPQSFAKFPVCAKKLTRHLAGTYPRHSYVDVNFYELTKEAMGTMPGS